LLHLRDMEVLPDEDDVAAHHTHI